MKIMHELKNGVPTGVYGSVNSVVFLNGKDKGDWDFLGDFKTEADAERAIRKIIKAISDLRQREMKR